MAALPPRPACGGPLSFSPAETRRCRAAAITRAKTRPPSRQPPPQRGKEGERSEPYLIAEQKCAAYLSIIHANSSYHEVQLGAILSNIFERGYPPSATETKPYRISCLPQGLR